MYYIHKLWDCLCFVPRITHVAFIVLMSLWLWIFCVGKHCEYAIQLKEDDFYSIWYIKRTTAFTWPSWQCISVLSPFHNHNNIDLSLNIASFFLYLCKLLAKEARKIWKKRNSEERSNKMNNGEKNWIPTLNKTMKCKKFEKYLL